MKNGKTIKNLSKLLVLCTAMGLCAFGVTACADKPQDETVTLNQLIEANNYLDVIKEYGNVHFLAKINANGEEVKTETHLSLDDYGLIYDCEKTRENGDVEESVTVMDGIQYRYNEQGLGFDIVVAEDYDKFIYDEYVGTVISQNLTSQPEVVDGKVYLNETKDAQTFSYVFNSQTLLIESVNVTTANQTCEYNYTYGVNYASPRTAYNMHQNATDKKDIIIIKDGKTENETRNDCTVSAFSDAGIFSDGAKQCEFFENVSCTFKMRFVNDYIANANYPTIYVGEERTDAIDFTYTYTQADYDEYLALLEDFKTKALNTQEPISSVQLAFEYMYDKQQYIVAQYIISDIIYCTDITVSEAFENNITVYQACLDANNAYNAVLKTLYEADVPYCDILFKDWTEDSINDLLGNNKQTAERINEIKIDNSELKRQVDALPVDDNWFNAAVTIFDKVMANNYELAELCGYDNYYDYACKETYRRDWAKEDITVFSDYVKKYLVPLYGQVKTRISEVVKTLDAETKQFVINLSNTERYQNLNIDYVERYFESFDGTLGEILSGVFDKGNMICATDNGQGDAFSGFIKYYGESYVFFGSGNDPGFYQGTFTVVHETGHYASYYYREEPKQSFDLSETYSIGNEMLFLAYLENYLSKSAFEYLVLIKLYSALDSLITCAIINEFELTVYNMETPPTAEYYIPLISQLCEEYNLGDESRYVLWIATAIPMYYVSYALANTSAIDLLITAMDDYSVAQERYRKLVEETTDADEYKKSLEIAGFNSPFDEQTFKNIVEAFGVAQ